MKAEVKLYFISAPETLMKERVLERSHRLPEGALVIDEQAIELFRDCFEPLDEDEFHVMVAWSAQSSSYNIPSAGLSAAD